MLYRKWCKIGGMLVLITNKKSYMSFRLVPKIGDPEWPWTAKWPLFRVISPNFVASAAHWVKVVKDIPKLSATKMSPKASSFSDISLTMIWYTWYRQFTNHRDVTRFLSVFDYLLLSVLFNMTKAMQLSTSCMKLVLERPVIRQWAYCKPTRYIL